MEEDIMTRKIFLETIPVLIMATVNIAMCLITRGHIAEINTGIEGSMIGTITKAQVHSVNPLFSTHLQYLIKETIPSPFKLTPHGLNTLTRLYR